MREREASWNILFFQNGRKFQLPKNCLFAKQTVSKSEPLGFGHTTNGSNLFVCPLRLLSLLLSGHLLSFCYSFTSCYFYFKSIIGAVPYNAAQVRVNEALLEAEKSMRRRRKKKKNKREKNKKRQMGESSGLPGKQLKLRASCAQFRAADHLCACATTLICVPVQT